MVSEIVEAVLSQEEAQLSTPANASALDDTTDTSRLLLVGDPHASSWSGPPDGPDRSELTSHSVLSHITCDVFPPPEPLYTIDATELQWWEQRHDGLWWAGYDGFQVEEGRFFNHDHCEEGEKEGNL